MDFIITFFRDTLDGTTYVIVCSVSAVLLCACIGYLADKKSKKKTEKVIENNEEKQQTTPSVENIASPQPENPTVQVAPTPQVSTVENQIPNPTNIPPVAPQPNVDPNLNTPTGQEQIQQVPTPPVMEENINNATPPVEPTTPQEQPIFPPVDNSVSSPIGIENSPVEATAPTPQLDGQIPQDQSIFPPTGQEQIQQVPTPPVMEENINNVVPPVEPVTPQEQPNADPNLNIPEGQPQQIQGQIENNIPLPNEAQPTMEAANLDMPQMPVAPTPPSSQVEPQAETLETTPNPTEQTEQNTIIDNQVSTNINLENANQQTNQAPQMPEQQVQSPVENQNI